MFDILLSFNTSIFPEKGKKNLMENYMPNLGLKCCTLQNVTQIDKEVSAVLSVATKITESVLKVLWLSMPWWLQNTFWCLRVSVSLTGFSSAECVMDSEHNLGVKFIQDLRQNVIFKNFIYIYIYIYICPRRPYSAFDEAECSAWIQSIFPQYSWQFSP